MTPDPDDLLLDERAAARMLSMSERSLQRWRSERAPGSPPWIRLSARCIRYSRRELLAWLEAKTIAA